MNIKVLDTLTKHEQQEFSGYADNRVCTLTSKYAALAGILVPPDVVGSWLSDEPINGISRTTMLRIERLSSLVREIANIDVVNASIATLSYYYSMLDLGYIDVNYHLDTILFTEAYKDLTKALKAAKSSEYSVEIQAARLFAAVSNFERLGVDGILAAAVLCDFHLLVNGVGSFSPSDECVRYLWSEIPVWRCNECDFDCTAGRNIVQTIAQNCIWHVNQ